MERVGWNRQKGPWCSGLLPKWTVCLSLRNRLSALYLMGKGVQNDLGEVGEVKGPLYSESAIMSLWLLGRLQKRCFPVQNALHNHKRKNNFRQATVTSYPSSRPFPARFQSSEGNRHATRQDHLIFNHVMGIYFLEFKVLQMCTDPCLMCV